MTASPNVASVRFSICLPSLNGADLLQIERRLDVRLRGIGDPQRYVVGQRSLLANENRLVALRVLQSEENVFTVDVIDTDLNAPAPEGFTQVMNQALQLQADLLQARF